MKKSSAKRRELLKSIGIAVGIWICGVYYGKITEVLYLTFVLMITTTIACYLKK